MPRPQTTEAAPYYFKYIDLVTSEDIVPAIQSQLLIEEFKTVRLGTISFFKNLPSDAWSRTGIASDNPFTVRAVAYIIAGHVAHHTQVLRDKYL